MPGSTSGVLEDAWFSLKRWRCVLLPPIGRCGQHFFFLADAHALAYSLLALPGAGANNLDGPVPDVGDILADFRYAEAPECSRLPVPGRGPEHQRCMLGVPEVSSTTSVVTAFSLI